MSEQLCVLPHDVERLAQDGHYLCPGHVKALPERIRQLADLPPTELLMLIDTTPTWAYEIPAQINHPLAHAWKKAMGSNNPVLPAVRQILFGEGANE